MAPAESSKLDSELAFVEGDTWPGIPSIQFIPPPSSPIQSARISFRDSFISTQTLEKLTSPEDILLVSKEDWIIKVPPKALRLQAGSYVWQLETVDEDDKVVTYMQGNISVLPDIVPLGEKDFQYFKLLLGHEVCGYPNSTPVYVYIATTTATPLVVGDFVYADQVLSIPLEVPQFSLGITQYTVFDGAIQSISVCGSAFSVFTDCNATSSITLYLLGSSFPPSNPAHLVFSDAYGTLFTGTALSNGVFYTFLQGQVVSSSPCPIELLTVRSDCTVFATYFQIYTSPALLLGQEVKDSGMNPYDGSFVYNFIEYVADNGILVSSSSCPPLPPIYSFNVYDGCGSPTVVTIYSLQPDPSVIGAVIYANESLSLYYSDSWFSTGSIRCLTDTFGVVIVSENCPASFTISDYCYLGGVTSNVYAAFGSSLSLGTVLYADEFFTLPFDNQVFYQNGYQYTTDSSSVIVSVDPCPPVQLFSYTYCPNYSPPPPSITLYANNYNLSPTSPPWQYIPFGTLICEDSSMTIPYVGMYGGGAAFNFLGISYSTDANGLVNSAVNSCY